ncbi:MAG: MFS transporter [Variovorax sp.]|nr:MFS transporter [Variovorax sp.]
MLIRAPRKRIAASAVVLAILCAMSFVMYIDRTNIATAALAIRAEMGLSNSQMGLVFSAFAVVYAVAMIPGSWIGDRIGAHRMLAICGVLWATGTLLTGIAGGLFGLIMARFIVGLGESAIVPTSAKALAVWMPPDRRGFAQGITHSFARLGNASAPMVVAALIVATSWRMMFVVLGVLSLAWVVLWVWYYRDDPRKHSRVTSDELARLSTAAQGARPRMRWGPLLRTLWPATLVSFCHGWALWFFLNWMPSYFAQNYHLDIKRSAIFSSAIFLGGVIGTTLGGVLSDMVLRRTKDVRRARRSVIVFGFLSPVLFLVPMLSNPTLNMAAICLGCAFFLSELVTAPLWAVAMDLAPRHAATSSGIMNTGLAIAATVSAPIVGWVIDHTGSWHLVFAMSMSVLVLGPIAACLIRPDRPYMGEGPGPDAKPRTDGLASDAPPVASAAAS